ncbi:Acetolactate synthase large subunit [Pseudonocardia sp. Ae168_Ps1]|uniref:thiamine pyrophosphate-binding protein n=1 Tax=unclassified Pseudonocardia TaxID=2619320 RepID=UPI00094B6ED3|nr:MULTISPECIES: thiamine pyrophosphate-binding protein [unclassified Pseudonocardia]OLL74513.1 Acetolactate synthase large subunit [Pseudonocardia sp. Ae150A_Ps1]OLL80493.1 Acetolactate synthase large subunit [Pseudonocardia sp. Ae168_Ps1]OLL85380.1 Acetolactate synthase large subunit [Pseudonocardia sp. Ae263_Ps1]OLL94593.1 Acetolactate synthase large subunit [Pseudonocardia sp. Ae356_Ps1]
MTGSAAAVPSPATTVHGAWAAVLDVLQGAGVHTLFGLPADDVALVRALRGRRTGPVLVTCADQRSAVFMATGYATAAGGVGVAVVGKGPAVTNTATGLLEAAASASPVLVLAAGTPAARRDAGAFQELDQLGAVRGLVSWAGRVDTPERLVPQLVRAIRTATGPVPGPVFLEIPDDLLAAEVPVRTLLPRSGDDAVGPADPDGAASRTVRSARRPLLLVGGGMRNAPAGRAEALADALGAPIVVTASGRGSVDEDHPRFVGLSGLYAPPATAELWARTDCVVALGSRLEETAVEGWPARIGTEVPVVQVNRSPREFSVEFDGPVVVGDAAAVAEGWTRPGGGAVPDWLVRAAGVRDRAIAESTADRRPTAPGAPPRVRDVLDALAACLDRDAVLVQENGLADMWTYHWPAWSCGSAGGSVVPSEQTPLGCGAAAAAGVKAAVGDRQVVAVVGDGALAMVDVELPPLVTAGLGVLYVVLDNGGYGWLERQLDDVPPAERAVFARPGAGGPVHDRVDHVTVSDVAGLRPAVERALRITEGGRPAVVRVPVALDDSPVEGLVPAGDVPVRPVADVHCSEEGERS